MKLTQSDRFDAPLRERIKLTQYHLTAATKAPANRLHLVTVITPHRAGRPPMGLSTDWKERGLRIVTEDERVIQVSSRGAITFGLRDQPPRQFKSR